MVVNSYRYCLFALPWREFLVNVGLALKIWSSHGNAHDQLMKKKERRATRQLRYHRLACPLLKHQGRLKIFADQNQRANVNAASFSSDACSRSY